MAVSEERELDREREEVLRTSSAASGTLPLYDVFQDPSSFEQAQRSAIPPLDSPSIGISQS